MSVHKGEGVKNVQNSVHMVYGCPLSYMLTMKSMFGAKNSNELNGFQVVISIPECHSNLCHKNMPKHYLELMNPNFNPGTYLVILEPLLAFNAYRD